MSSFREVLRSGVVATNHFTSVYRFNRPSFARSLSTKRETPAARKTRQMSSSAGQAPGPQKEWLVILPDHPNVLSKRVSVRPEHLVGTKANVATGKVLMGGATLSKHPAEGEAPDMTGSVLLITAESEEEVKRFAAEDVYTKSGVWNMDAITVWPFRTAVRKGVEVGSKPW